MRFDNTIALLQALALVLYVLTMVALAVFVVPLCSSPIVMIPCVIVGITLALLPLALFMDLENR